MKPAVLFLAAALASSSAFAETKTIDVGPNPESVTKGFGGNYYVTLMGPTRNPGDGDGGIVVIENGAVKPFVSGLNDPKGIVFLDDSLITADFTQVWRIDSKGGKKLLAGPENFPNPILFLNDVAIAADGKSVLVTDMGARDKIAGPGADGFLPLDSPEAAAVPAVGRVYQITLDGKVTEVVSADERMKCPNGVDVTPDGKIRVAEFFTGKILEVAGKGEFKVLAEGHRSADAIVHDSKGNFYVTEVKTGNVWKYPGKVKMGEGLTAAADAFVDEKAGFLVVPETKAGKLVFLPL